MSKWEGSDPGVVSQKTPSILLLTPQRQFHSFGFTARNHYHDLADADARRWLYFDKFKMALYQSAVKHRQYQCVAWAAPAGWRGGGSCPLCPMPCPLGCLPSRRENIRALSTLPVHCRRSVNFM